MSKPAFAIATLVGLWLLPPHAALAQSAAGAPTTRMPNAEYLATAGAKMSPNIPFYRIGEPAVIPFSPTSANTEVPVTVPDGATSFQYTLNAPCAVRFRGRLGSAAFVPVTTTTGWLWLPGTARVYTSLQPVSVSIMSVDGPNASVQAAQKACSGTLELQYGTGQ
jgi:hypothetical protein